MDESSGEDKGPWSVGEILDLLSTIYGRAAAALIDDIGLMASPPGGDSDPTRETLQSYLRPAGPQKVGNRIVNRRNRETPLHHRFAHLVVNYLDGRRPKGQLEPLIQTLTTNPMWIKARGRCLTVLKDERDRRFEHTLGRDPGTQGAISALVGAYAVSRRETNDEQYHQELLVLSNHGSTAVPRCHCTYVTSRLVMRGEWMLVGDMLHCSMSGLHENNSHELCGLYLAYPAGPAAEPDLLVGLLAGTGTQGKVPVSMPLVAAKIPQAASDIHQLGHLGDTAILSAFREFELDLSDIQVDLVGILEDRMEAIAFGPQDYTPALRGRFPNGNGLVDPQLVQFCADFRAWPPEAQAEK